MSYLFAPRAPFALPITGREDLYPVSRIFCVGRNYAAHAAEMGAEVDREAPFYFTVSPHHASLGGDVAYPDGTDDYHHEVECVVALSGDAHQISPAQAANLVFGYGVGLDMTRRDRQAEAKATRRPWCLGKDVEGSAILGTLTPHDELGPLSIQEISLQVNGKIVQQSHVSLMVHSIPEIISHLSHYYHLGAGDVIMSGTPEGVGPVERGDELQARLEGCATLDVRFV